MRIQAFLTAAAVNLKRLAATLLALLGPWRGISLLAAFAHLLASATTSVQTTRSELADGPA